MYIAFAPMLLMIVVIGIVLIHPFKKEFSRASDVNTLFLLLLAVFNAALLFLAIQTKSISKIVVYTGGLLSVLPILYISILVLYWVYTHRHLA